MNFEEFSREFQLAAHGGDSEVVWLVRSHLDAMLLKINA